MANEEGFRVFEGMDDLVRKLTGQERREKDLERKVIESFEARYVEFLTGNDSAKILYKGDFKYAKLPRELILPGAEEEESVNYEELARQFFSIVGNDIIGKIKNDIIYKLSHGETRNLERFRKQNPDRPLVMNLAYFNLKSPPKEPHVLLIETYQENPDSLIPLAEIWTAKRLDLSILGDNDSSNRYKIQPRSMVRIASLPAKTEQ